MGSLFRYLKPWAGVVFALSLLPAGTRAQGYTRTDLVSNQPGVAANTDAQVVNGWGLVQLVTSTNPPAATPFWISDNGTGLSTLYSGTGAQVQLFVTIPPAPGSPAGTLGTPTGVVGNIDANPADFQVTENGKSSKALFIFATLDGTISGWSPAVAGVSATGQSHATIAFPPPGGASNGASYTGLAIATDQSSGQTFLYAADDGPNRRVDVFNSSFTPQTPLEDPGIPREFAPYGIQNINGDIWVTYTALNKAQGGFVDVFGTDGTLKRHFAVHGPLHSPWGIALAPADFGPMSNAMLISNNTPRGRINAFDPNTGDFLGPLRDASGNPIEIDNVWAIQFGHDGGPSTSHNQLFFTAGPNNYANGLFGVITAGQ